MPRDDTAVKRGLYKKLVVPKSHRPSQELFRRCDNCRMKDQIVKQLGNTPRTKCMKQDTILPAGLVSMIFVETGIVSHLALHQPPQFIAESVDLIRVEDL